MPTIIGNQDNGQAKTLADAFSRFADSTWGAGAQNAELRGAQTQEARQRAFQLSDQNQRSSDLLRLQSQGIDITDPHQMALAVATGKVSESTAAALAREAMANDPTSKRTAQAQLAAGQGYGQTGQNALMTNATARRGQDLTGQTQRDVARIQGENQRALELEKQASESIPVIDPTTRQTVLMSRRDAIAKGAAPVQSLDQTKAAALQAYLSGRQPQGGPAAPAQQALPDPQFNPDGTLNPPPGLTGGQPVPAPTGNDLTRTAPAPQAAPALGTNPAAPAGAAGPTGTVRPQPPAQAKPEGLQPNLLLGADAPLGIQEMMGEKQTNIPMVEPTGARRQGVSRDGGQTVGLPDGTTVLAQGFLPAGPESALNQGRFNGILSEDKPWLERNQNADPSRSGAMQAILKLGGPGQLIGNELNTFLGATGLNKVLTPMINRDVSAAQQNLTVWNEQMIKGLGISADPGQKEQRRIAETLLLDTGFLQNPAQESMKIPALANALVQRNEVLHRQLKSIPDPSSPRVGQLMQDIAENEKSLDMLTDPNWGDKPFNVSTSPINALEAQNGRAGNNPDGTPRQAMPTATGPNGQKVQWNGQQWVPMNGR